MIAYFLTRDELLALRQLNGIDDTVPAVRVPLRPPPFAPMKEDDVYRSLQTRTYEYRGMHFNGYRVYEEVYSA